MVKPAGLAHVARHVEVYRCSNYKGHPLVDQTVGGSDHTEENGECNR